MFRHALIAVLLAAPLSVCAAPVNSVEIFEIQYTTDPSGDSPLVGQTVTTAGVVTAITADGFTIADSVGAWHAIFIYTIAGGPVVGDSVQVTGAVHEYYGMTEIADVTDFQLLSSGHPVVPLTVTSADASQEAYESVLLQIEAGTVTELLSYGEWVLDDALVCDDLNDYVYFPEVGDLLDSLTGVLFYSYGAFKLEPRTTSDIAGEPIPHYALGGDVVTMNVAGDVLSDHYVEVVGDQIVAIHSSPPIGILVVETSGVIFPGLIDAHNHAAYNVLGVIPFGVTFEDRYEWQDSPLYAEFKDQYKAIRDYGGSGALTDFIHKLAELRALCAGTTTIQGVNCNGHQYDTYAHQGMGINNAERFPNRILSSTFPLSQSATYWQNRADEYWDRFVIHLAEGVNTAASGEFDAWQALGVLDYRTTIIHGLALGAPEWAALSAVGGHVVWSPRSNVILYGQTADIPGALSAGVNVALAPDWTESGSLHMLEEMKFARTIGDSLWGGALTPRLLTEMVTCNAADALGATGRIGTITVGYTADLMVIPGTAIAPYDSLLAAEPEDVALTVVSGRPMYGDLSLMAQFDFLGDTEDIMIGGTYKRLAVLIASHAIPDSDVPTAEVIAALEAAYAESYPPICCFLGIEPDSCARAPVAHGDNYEVAFGGSLVVEAPGVLENDFDGDGDTLEAVLIDGPDYGAFALEVDGGFTYEHNGTIADTDSFVYLAADGELNSNPMTVIISILDPTGIHGPVPRHTAAWMRVHPNPFNPTATIDYYLPKRQRVEIAVFDITGRRVAVLDNRIDEAGRHSLIWDCRDGSGRTLSSGVYLVRIRGDHDSLVRKVVLLK
jgi:cytosine/adenosine deaminase-related metal-dependent hydrolase